LRFAELSNGQLDIALPNTCVKASTKNKAKARVKELKGKVKSKAGKATRNPRLRDEGDAETIGGKV
jgi:hypothetical protein